MDNKSTGKYKDSELFKAGTYIGHTLIKFKHTKKKFTKFPIYLMGYAMPPGDPDIWKSFPPQKININFMYSSGGYFASLDDEGKIEWSIMLRPFGIDTDKKEFNLLNVIKLPGQGISIMGSSNYYPDDEERCEILDKKEFNKIIKVGIKKNTDTKSNDDLIKNLNELYKSGALTKEEFEKAKKRILNK